MKKSFTLLELLIVVIVISILATFATPQYMKAVERVKVAKATHNLSLIAQAQKMYRARFDTYLIIGDGELADSGGLVEFVELFDINADEEWSYGVQTATENAFIAEAFRLRGPYLGSIVNVDERNIYDGDHPLLN